MKLRIDKKLNLVLTFDMEDGSKIHVYSIPISRDVFDTYFEELGEVFIKSFGEKGNAYLALAAPQLAYAALKKASDARGTWEQVKAGLITEIVRLTHVVFLTENGWETLPIHIAIQRGILDEDTEREVLSSLIFFTAMQYTAPKAYRTLFFQMLESSRQWATTPSSITDFINGLPISTEVETLATPTSSRVPSPT